MNKEQVYRIGFLAFNLNLIAAALLFVGSVIIPLLGGTFITGAVIRSASWMSLALVGKIILSRMQRGLQIGAFEYTLSGVFTIVYIVFWFPYPFSVALSILTVVVLAYSYKVRARMQ